MTEDKKIIDATEVWHIAADALHTHDFRTKYLDALDFAIREKRLSILDTAAGTGFPTVDLYKAGFTNIEASDADKKSVDLLQKYFQNVNIPIPVSEGKWQELSQKISKRFDVIINTDNSFVYMDGWSEGGHFASGTEAVFERISLVLKNFYDVLNDRGFVIIGLSRHYHPGTKDYRLPLEYEQNGEKVNIEWYGAMDWETRENRWTVKVEGGKFRGEFLKRSYAVTKEEVADLMRKIGFKRVHILEPDGTRDNFIIGLRSSRLTD
jgi:SAM-dependent methyltransferase